MDWSIPGSIDATVNLGPVNCGGETWCLASDPILIGRWRHPDARGKIIIAQKNRITGVVWKGSVFFGAKNQVQISGNSMVLTTQINHPDEYCSISFKLSEIMN